MSPSPRPNASTGASPIVPGALPDGAWVGGFELVRVVGATPLGIDYRAVDRARGTEVVLREYLPQRVARRESDGVRPISARHADALARGIAAFTDESRTLMRIEHPSLVRVTDVFEAGGTVYQVTLHRGGSSLADLRPRLREAPSEAALRRLLDGLLGALEALHRHGIAHGALAPEQILLLNQDWPLLRAPDPSRADIAPALIAPLMSAAERALAAPELLAPSPSRPIGPWTDLYSLAATMRWWIAGEPPRPAAATPGSAPEPTAAMLRRCRIETRYSAQLLDALDMALATAPDARPESVAQFRRALGSRPSTPPFPLRPAVPPARTPAALPPHAAEPDAIVWSARPKRELPLQDFLRAHGAPPGMFGAWPARRIRPRAKWTGGAAALLVAASCAAWQLTQQMPIERPAQIVDILMPAWHAVSEALDESAPGGTR